MYKVKISDGVEVNVTESVDDQNVKTVIEELKQNKNIYVNVDESSKTIEVMKVVME